jgi:RimJ/RimL family protein N-acetyltransferase
VIEILNLFIKFFSPMNRTELHFRKAENDDISMIVESLMNGAAQGHYTMGNSQPMLPSMVKGILYNEYLQLVSDNEEIEASEARFFVLEIPKIGSVGFFLVRFIEGVPLTVEILVFDILPCYRSKGIGLAGLQLIENNLPNKETTVLQVRCLPRSKAMMHLCRKLGYSLVRKTKQGSEHYEKRFFADSDHL